MRAAAKVVPASGEASAPSDDTTLRVSRTNAECLKLIAALEKGTIYDVTTRAVTEFIERFESVAGFSIFDRIKKPAR